MSALDRCQIEVRLRLRDPLARVVAQFPQHDGLAKLFAHVEEDEVCFTISARTLLVAAATSARKGGRIGQSEVIRNIILELKKLAPPRTVFGRFAVGGKRIIDPKVR